MGAVEANTSKKGEFGVITNCAPIPAATGDSRREKNLDAGNIGKPTSEGSRRRRGSSLYRVTTIVAGTRRQDASKEKEKPRLQAEIRSGNENTFGRDLEGDAELGSKGQLRVW